MLLSYDHTAELLKLNEVLSI